MFCDEEKRKELLKAICEVVKKTLEDPTRPLSADLSEAEPVPQAKEEVMEEEEEEEEEGEEEEEQGEEEEKVEEQEEGEENEEEGEEENEEEEEEGENEEEAEAEAEENPMEEEEAEPEPEMTYGEVWKSQAWTVFWKRLIAALDNSESSDLLEKEIITPLKSSFLPLLERYPESLFLARKLLKTKNASQQMKQVLKPNQSALSKLFASGDYKGYDDVMQMLKAK
ncbi:uncharacterized protein [Blastocystis hominis]|uniref:Uncharacterized protein n=1 Tax=Blastocystis hominis TaxID=12968 RepID=D8M8D6_BLAHO|nr:uncharacterized protein [Blastocystis hominis]CBK24325.2 unnamed protein product [Blastocystis hominis]|eukprot:XP_012898373.1 uncharacterized protein [Blastocystis hominis]